MSRPVRTLLFSSLYPSSVLPRAGIFVETRLRELLKTGRVTAKVVAPVRWSPVHNAKFGVYAQIAAAPKREVLNGIDVLHPKFLTIPKLGMNLAPFLLALGAARSMHQLREEGFDFEVIDAHYYYPDGVAAAILSHWFDRPLAITARGSDVNLIGNFAWPTWLMKKAARKASASIGVSEALVARMKALGFDPAKLLVLRNGIDLQRFFPDDRALTKAALGLAQGPVMLTVGNLKENKGQRLVIKALPLVLAKFPNVQLVVLGDGPDAGALREIARTQGLGEHIRFVSTMPQDQLRLWYSAADVLVLASANEGWPNVLLESMACGTPVVASDVGGVREIVRDRRAGRVVSQRTEDAIAQAVGEVLEQRIASTDVRNYSEQYNWDSTSRSQAELFERMAGRSGNTASALEEVHPQLQEEL